MPPFLEMQTMRRVQVHGHRQSASQSSIDDVFDTPQDTAAINRLKRRKKFNLVQKASHAQLGEVI